MSASAPLVSILIPCHDAEKYVADAIESALAQTWPNKEIIVVDDGSTDRSRNLAHSFRSSRVEVLAQNRRGAAAARNTALRRAKGHYIQFLDADDLLAPDKIAQQMERALHVGDAFVLSCAWGKFQSNPGRARFVRERVWADMLPLDWLVASWSGGGMMHPAAWLTPRSIIDRAGEWDETLSLNDDGEYFTRVLLNSDGVRFCDDGRSFYRAVSGSLSSGNCRLALESAFRVCELQMRCALNREDSPRVRTACADNFQRFVFTVYPDALDLVSLAERHVAELGGSQLEAPGGSKFHGIEKLAGWKTARRLQRWQRKILLPLGMKASEAEAC